MTRTGRTARTAHDRQALADTIVSEVADATLGRVLAGAQPGFAEVQGGHLEVGAVSADLHEICDRLSGGDGGGVTATALVARVLLADHDPEEEWDWGPPDGGVGDQILDAAIRVAAS